MMTAPGLGQIYQKYRVIVHTEDADITELAALAGSKYFDVAPTSIEGITQ